MEDKIWAILDEFDFSINPTDDDIEEKYGAIRQKATNQLLDLISKEKAKERAILLKRQKSLLEQHEKMLESDKQDRLTYKRTGLVKDLERVKLNEGTTAHYQAGIITGKLQIIEELLQAPDKPIE